MTVTRFKIIAPTFDAELIISLVTHRVVKAAPVLQWMETLDRFEVFRIAARQDWEVKFNIPDTNHEQLEPQQTLSQLYSDSHSHVNGPRESREDWEGA